MSPTILFVRHSESVFNAANVWAGQLDPQLTDHGKNYAINIGEKYKNKKIDQIISSDLIRAVEGSQIISKISNIRKLPPDTRLRERHAGEWEGKKLTELANDTLYKQYLQNFKTTPPGGEKYEFFTKRILSFMKDYTQKPYITLAVCHYGVLQALSDYFGLESQEHLPLEAGVKVTKTKSSTLSADFFNVNELYQW